MLEIYKLPVCLGLQSESEGREKRRSRRPSEILSLAMAKNAGGRKNVPKTKSTMADAFGFFGHSLIQRATHTQTSGSLSVET